MDVDGVLNCAKTKERYKGFIGIDSELVANLADIVNISRLEEDTEIVLTSSWRIGKSRKGEEITDSYSYLMKKLCEYGLSIYDDTPRLTWGKGRSKRGREIQGWLYVNRHLDISNYVVLDDEEYADYDKYGVTPHLVKTSFKGDGGLRKEHVRSALNVLRKSMD